MALKSSTPVLELLPSAAGLAVAPFEIIPFLFYPYLLGICALVFIAIWGNKEKMR